MMMKKNVKVIKWIALIIGGLGILFFGAFIFGEGIPDLRDSDDPQLKTMLLLMAFAAFGYFFSFFKSKEGGIVLTFSGFLLGMNMLFYGGMDDFVPALIYAIPFLIPGIMLWWIGKEKVKD